MAAGSDKESKESKEGQSTDWHCVCFVLTPFAGLKRTMKRQVVG